MVKSEQKGEYRGRPLDFRRESELDDHETEPCAISQRSSLSVDQTRSERLKSCKKRIRKAPRHEVDLASLVLFEPSSASTECPHVDSVSFSSYRLKSIHANSCHSLATASKPHGPNVMDCRRKHVIFAGACREGGPSPIGPEPCLYPCVAGNRSRGPDDLHTSYWTKRRGHAVPRRA